MKILYIDMDGVIADFDKYVNPFLPDVELGDGNPETYEYRSKIVDKFISENPNMFEHLELIEGAYESINYLKDHFDIYFLSTPVYKVPESYKGKRLWIKKHFGDWGDKRLILTHRKDLCIGDYLVDDRLKNGSENFKGDHIHFRQGIFKDWNTVVNYLMSF